MKATKAQLDVMRKMNAGYRLYWYCGLRNWKLKRGGPHGRGKELPVKKTTADSLAESRLVNRENWGCRHDQYVVTVLGRAALAAAPAKKGPR